MYGNALEFGPKKFLSSESLATMLPPLHRADDAPNLTPISIVLANGHCMFRQGLAALIYTEPAVRLLEQVCDGESAWHAIQAHNPDIAILDLDLGQVSGIEIARRTADQALPTRCLVIESHLALGQASEALRAGVAGYIHQDDGFEVLMLALRSIHAGGIFLSPVIASRMGEGEGGKHRFITAPSPREREVMRLLAAGNSSKEIARTLAISPLTVETHRRRVMAKLDLHSAAEVACYALRNGMLG